MVIYFDYEGKEKRPIGATEMRYLFQRKKRLPTRGYEIPPHESLFYRAYRRIIEDHSLLRDENRVQWSKLNPGHWQRSSGAWVWEISIGGMQFGSSSPLKECLKYKSWYYGNNGNIWDSIS